MSEALDTYDVIVEELASLRSELDPKAFERACAMIRDAGAKSGRVHVTGIGKSEHVARYAAALLAATGTPTSFLAGAEVGHGSAGQVVRGDIVIAISNSGETDELRTGIEAVLRLGARLLAVSGSATSWLARQAETHLLAGVAREGGGLGLAPRASAAAQLVVLAALSAALEREQGFTRGDFHARHPAGSLGKKTASD